MTSSIDRANYETGAKNERYIEDAKQAGDNDLITFFRELKEARYHTAEKAKRLLKNRLD